MCIELCSAFRTYELMSILIEAYLIFPLQLEHLLLQFLLGTRKRRPGFCWLAVKGDFGRVGGWSRVGI